MMKNQDPIIQFLFKQLISNYNIEYHILNAYLKRISEGNNALKLVVIAFNLEIIYLNNKNANRIVKNKILKTLEFLEKYPQASIRLIKMILEVEKEYFILLEELEI